MRRWLKRAATALAIVAAIPLGYIAASFAGALIPGSYDVPKHVEREPRRQIILIMGLLHADFALPVDNELKERLRFLSETGFPLDNPNLKYITAGWGSKAFYTTAGTYADIEPEALFKAITGDEAVMRFVGFGVIAGLPDTARLSLTDKQYERLLDSITDVLKTESGKPDWMEGESIGPNDAFFEAKGHFNIFYPCNQWANRVLREAGVPLGIWTPTAQAFRLSLTMYADAIAE